MPAWLDIAKDNLGLKEVPGRGSNPKVVAFYADAELVSPKVDGFRYGALYCPSSLDNPRPESADLHAVTLCGLSEGHLFSKYTKQDVGSAIATLHRPRNPTTVFWAVVSVIVSAVKGVPLWPLAHVGQKDGEAVAPTLAHGDAARSVVPKVGPMRLMTAAPHVNPYSVLNRICHAVCFIGVPRGPTPLFQPKATTRFCSPKPDGRCGALEANRATRAVARDNAAGLRCYRQPSECTRHRGCLAIAPAREAAARFFVSRSQARGASPHARSSTSAVTNNKFPTPLNNIETAMPSMNWFHSNHNSLCDIIAWKSMIYEGI